MNTKDKKKWITVPVIAFMLLWALPSTAQQIAVKTNVLSDLGLVPNIGAELTVGEKTSLEFGLTGVIADPWGLDFDLTMGSFQYRYWIPQRALTQLFVGAGVKAGSYRYSSSSTLFEGDFAAAELVGGWAWPIAKRWNLEVSYGFGLVMRHQYEIEHEAAATVSPSMKYDIATTTLGVSFVYIIK